MPHQETVTIALFSGYKIISLNYSHQIGLAGWMLCLALMAGPAMATNDWIITDLSPKSQLDKTWHPISWSVKNGAGYDLQIASDAGGESFLEIRNIGYQGYGVFRLTVPAPVGANVSCRLALEVSASDCQKPQIVVRQRDAPVKNEWDREICHFPPVGTYPWRAMEFCFTTLPGTTALLIDLQNADGGIMRYRRIKLAVCPSSESGVVNSCSR